jgi:hypothetical protein
MPEALNRTKATRRRSSSPLWHNLIRVCHGIGDRSISVYAQGKVWVAERQTGKAILQAGQRMVASLHAMSRQALGLQYKGLPGGCCRDHYPGGYVEGPTVASHVVERPD